jgi:tRNA(fMet)-specific endonuclease VapC
MNIVLLDTTVASFLFNKNEERLLPYLSHIKGNRMTLCFQSVAELWKGAVKVKWNKKRREDLLSFINKWFTIIPYDERLIYEWAEISTESERQGYRFECGDAWIAATARLFNLPLLTHDSDFARVKIPGFKVICYVAE